MDTRIFFTKYSAVLLGILCMFFALILGLMGRTFFGPPGFGLWTWSSISPSTSQLLGDPYSFSHVLHGILFFGSLWILARRIPLAERFVIATAIEMAWEVLENSPLIIDRYRAATASLDYYGDSIFNSLGDVLCMMLGFWLAARLGWKWSLVVIVAVELIMLALMRDNLTLNILMLVHPVEAIKAWQLGQ